MKHSQKKTNKNFNDVLVKIKILLLAYSTEFILDLIIFKQ